VTKLEGWADGSIPSSTRRWRAWRSKARRASAAFPAHKWAVISTLTALSRRGSALIAIVATSTASAIWSALHKRAGGHEAASAGAARVPKEPRIVPHWQEIVTQAEWRELGRGAHGESSAAAQTTKSSTSTPTVGFSVSPL
jgi:hypothetical protein